MTAALPAEAAGKPVEVWFTDEARVGQQGTLTRVWAQRGLRPRAPRDLYCRDRNLPHPGFLVLDTPLLTYRDPITSKYGELSEDEKELTQLPLKAHFFEHLSTESRANQFIILENIDLPASIGELAHVEFFYGDNIGGRQGLFPEV